MKTSDTGEGSDPDILEEHLSILPAIFQYETDAFFYTRLKARMERQQSGSEWLFAPAARWVLGSLAILFVLNLLLLKPGTREEASTQSSTLHDFAMSYEQPVTTIY